jgi:tryptophan 2,3-dioxygenase
MCYTYLRGGGYVQYQNVTLSLPKDILRRAKHLAIEQQTSLSGLLTRLLEDLVRKEDAYRKARESHLDTLNRIFDIGTQGRTKWSRDDLHAR